MSDAVDKGISFAHKCAAFLRDAKPTPREFMAAWSLLFLKFCRSRKLDPIAELQKMAQHFPDRTTAPPATPPRPPVN